jgi:hypothetical protein
MPNEHLKSTLSVAQSRASLIAAEIDLLLLSRVTAQSRTSLSAAPAPLPTWQYSQIANLALLTTWYNSLFA